MPSSMNVAQCSLDGLPPGAVLVDVRERHEWDAGHLPKALHWPGGSGPLGDAAPDALFAVYCETGQRARAAAGELRRQGLRVVVLLPGMKAWHEQGRAVVVPSTLSAAERARYARHLSLKEIGEAGQRRLRQSRVLLLGAGGLGSPAALYLAAAGIGEIGIVDDDAVELSNLQRQVLHRTAAVGEAKVSSAKGRLQELNPDVRVHGFCLRLGPSNIDEVFGAGWDVIVDGLDNFPSRYLVNRAALRHSIPVVHGSILRFSGRVSVFGAGAGPCYECVYPEGDGVTPGPSCGEAGVLGVLPGVVGTIQATEALKLVLGIGSTLSGRLLTYDALEMEFATFGVPRDPECAACGRD